MKTYEVFEKYGQTVAVKQGFSWPAFFFWWIWPFTKGLILPGIIAIVLFFCWPVLVIIYGMKGNKWWANRLVKNGFVLVGTVQARNQTEAVVVVGTVQGRNQTEAVASNLQRKSPMECKSCGAQIADSSSQCYFCNAAVSTIMLCVTVLTGGLGVIIMSPFGLIEGVIYLTTSDQDFIATYVVREIGRF